MTRRARVDAELVRRGLARSRQQAAELIGAGRVTIDGMRAAKPATAVAVTAALALGLAGRALAEASPSPRGRRLADGVAIASLMQLGAGGLNVLLLAPVWMQLVHLVMADTIWIGATWMLLECLAAEADRSYADASRAK